MKGQEGKREERGEVKRTEGRMGGDIGGGEGREI